MKIRLFTAFAFLILAGASFAKPPVPALTGRVVDDARIMGDAAARRVSESARLHEEQTGNQLAVLTVSSLDESSIEEFAVDVFANWKLGQKGRDNGVLLVVAPNERRMRIEVGYGLEGVLTDAAAGSIIRDTITPAFKSGDMDRGIEEGAGAIIRILEGGALPAASNEELPEGFTHLSTSEKILFGSFIFGIIGLFTVVGILTPGMGWFLYFFLIPFWAMFPIAIIGVSATLTLLIIYLIAYPLVKVLLSRSDWYKKNARASSTKGSSRSVGGYSWGSSSSSGGWSSSSSGSSGFSGGGGRSGGGGASGGW